MPRLKDFSKWGALSEQGFGLRDVAVACGYESPSHRRIAHIYDLLFPHRTSRDEIKQSVEAMVRTALIDQLIEAGCSDEQALRKSAEFMNQIADDLVAGRRSGFIAILRGQHEVLRDPVYVDYESEETFSDWFDERGNLADGRNCCQWVTIDTDGLFTAVAENLKRYLEKFESTGRYTAEALAAAKSSMDSLRDLIESAYTSGKEYQQ